MGVQDDPLIIDEGHTLEYKVEFVSDGLLHGLGVQIAVGGIQIPFV